jgi:hypothetical protein
VRPRGTGERRKADRGPAGAILTVGPPRDSAASERLTGPAPHTRRRPSCQSLSWTIGMVINGAPAADIQAALTVVGRRSTGRGTVDLAQAKISQTYLDQMFA